MSAIARRLSPVCPARFELGLVSQRGPAANDACLPRSGSEISQAITDFLFCEGPLTQQSIDLFTQVRRSRRED
jgi:hypothetical protein